MAKKNVAVLDFGTNKVVILIGERGINGTFDVKGYSEVKYAGFMDGEILEPDKLQDALCQAINTAQNDARAKITHLYIGVPAEFSVAKVQNVEKIYGKMKRINNRDIDEMFSLADEFGSSPTHIVINRSPICFQIDTGEAFIDPEGQVSTNLKATLGFILAERKFVSTVGQAVAPMGIDNVEFISEPLAEALYLIEPSERDRCSILVDCGYLSTSVSVVVGDGLVCMKSFALGGGLIVADLSEYLKIPFPLAEEVKKLAVLAGQPNESEKINLVYEGENYQFDARTVYEIVNRRVRQIAKMVSKCLDACVYERPDYVGIKLTGGGISYIKGINDRIGEYLGKRVEIVTPNISQMNEAKNSAVLGLLDLALKQNHTNYSLFVKIFKK